ncbi:DUF6884 domain-containing protein [Metabacillus sp. RGM 3146]|uniref:DUF6884 domain-containing protein n=1 Tax=Metabacillus sp. RGM 3146 TaxID=3401092 RepID=UPI003B9B998B
MNRLCVIPCGKRKIWDKGDYEGPALAKNAYTGIFHRLCQQYANLFFTDWTILSAKHGFLLPDDEVAENYDLSFSMKKEDIISLARLKKQILDKNLSGYDEIVILGGKKFKPIVEESFGKGPVYHYPLKEIQGIGYMQKRLKQAIEQRNEI